MGSTGPSCQWGRVLACDLTIKHIEFGGSGLLLWQAQGFLG